MELIDQYGLYAFLQTSGLDITQISSVFKNMSIPKQLLKEYIRDFVLNHGNKWGVNAAILSGYEIELSDNKYVDDIEVLDVDSISVNVFDLEYGSKENKTSINALTNDELLTIIEWMVKTIKNGEWN